MALRSVGVNPTCRASLKRDGKRSGNRTSNDKQLTSSRSLLTTTSSTALSVLLHTCLVTPKALSADESAQADTDLAGDSLRAFADTVDLFAAGLSKATEAVQSVSTGIAKAASYAQPVAAATSAYVQRKAAPAASSLLAYAEQNPPVRTAEQAVAKTAAPVISSVENQFGSISATDALQFALAMAIFVNIWPSVSYALVKRIRGYAGLLRPTQAADLMVEGKGRVLVDIRSSVARRRRGVVRLGPSVSSRMYSVPRDAVRSKFFSDLAFELVAIKVAALKGVTPNTDMIIMDQGTSGAKKVARALTSQGFKNAYVLDGGFRRWQGTPALAIQPAPEADEQRRASQDNVQQTQSLPVLSTGRR